MMSALGALLRSPLIEALAAPHGVDRYLELVAPLWVKDEIRARIVDRRAETADCSTLTLAPGRAWPGFAAGQHVRVGVTIDGVRHTRCFSIASSAHRDDGCIEVTVKGHADGFVSRHLARKARPGDVLTLSPPGGEFVLPEPRPERLLLVSGGSGITPLMSMLRTLLDEGHTGEVVFLHYARGYDDTIFDAELRALAEAGDNLRVVRAVTREAPRGGDLAGHFTPAQLESVLPDYAAVPAYACGPRPLIEAMQAHWQALGAADRLAVEFFRPPARTGAASGGEIRFARSDRLAIDNGATLLEQAEAAGLSPEHGCRMGICHSCVCQKTAGTVRHVFSGELSGAGEEEIQPCVSVPVGDVTLDL